MLEPTMPPPMMTTSAEVLTFDQFSSWMALARSLMKDLTFSGVTAIIAVTSKHVYLPGRYRFDIESVSRRPFNNLHSPFGAFTNPRPLARKPFLCRCGSAADLPRAGG